MKRSLQYIVIVVFSLITLKAQEYIQPEWISPVGTISAVSDDKTKIVTLNTKGFTYNDLKKGTAYTKLFKNKELSLSEWSSSESIAISNNGKYIVVLRQWHSSNGVQVFTLTTWNAESGKEMLSKKFEETVGYSIFDPVFITSDNKYIVLSINGKVMLFDLLLLTYNKTLGNTGYPIQRIKISPKGNFVLIIENDTIAKIWSTKTWQLHGTIQSEYKKLKITNFSPDDSKIIINEELSKISKIWNLADMTLISCIKDEEFSPRYISFSNNTDYLATISNNTVSIWDAKKGEKIKSLEKDTSFAEVIEVFYTEKGDRVITNRDDGVIQLLDIDEGKKVADIKSNKLIHFLNDKGVYGDTLLTAGNGYKTYIWTLTDKNYQITDSIISYDEVKYASFGNSDRQIRLFASSLHSWDISSKKKVRSDNATDIDGELLTSSGAIAAMNVKKNIELWNMEENNKLLQMPYKNVPSSVSVILNKKGDRALIAREDGSVAKKSIVKIFDTEKSEYISNIKDSVVFTYKSYLESLSPDGNKILIGEYNGENKKVVQVIDLTKSNIPTVVLSDTNLTVSTFFSPEGKQILVTDSKRFVYVFDANTYQPLNTFYNGEQIVGWREKLKVSYGNSDSIMAMFGLGNRVEIWNTITGQKIVTLNHQQNVNSIQFSKNGKEIITACSDENAYVWDINTGSVKYILQGSNDSLIHIRYNESGNKVVATSFRGPALLWDLSVATSAVDYSETTQNSSPAMIYPNPAENSIKIYLNIASNNPMNCHITNSVGETVLSGIIPAGSEHYTMPIHNLSAGMYIFSAEVNGKRVHEKFVVMR